MSIAITITRLQRVKLLIHNCNMSLHKEHDCDGMSFLKHHEELFHRYYMLMSVVYTTCMLIYVVYTTCMLIFVVYTTCMMMCVVYTACILMSV